MKISEQWLRTWVDPKVDSETLGEQLTMAGLELDGRESVAKPFSGVVVGEVLAVEAHPDADKLRVTRVSIGSGDPLQIVCGASNVRAGLKVAVATVGAVLPSADGKGFAIKKSKLRGVVSEGMLCGASEIDLPDVIDGLLELPEEAPVGQNIRDYLGLDGQIFDIAITPNRGDCFSVRGISREMGVINDLPVNVPDIVVPDPTQAVSVGVQVLAPDLCPRYFAQPIMQIDRRVQSPKWMTDRLVQSGLRVHNFLVDVTNYVLLELGQPLHAFDADKIVGQICVRLAKAGESVELLNDQTITLMGDELVIADDEGVLALAGVMGGKRSSVSDETVNIVLESAFFDPLAIAGRARRFGLHTDASQRFERGVDFELPKLALARATALIHEIAGGQVGQISLVEDLTCLPKRYEIVLPVRKVFEVLGVEIAVDRMVRILSQLGLVVCQTVLESGANQGDQALVCVPPSWRFDLNIAEDLIEEIARIYGYNHIESQLPSLTVDMTYDDGADLTQALKLTLVDLGYMEAVSFSFSDEKLEQRLDDPDLGAMLPLANPISSDLAVMRRTLLSSLLPCVQYNLNRQQNRVRFFETGLSFVGASVQDLIQTPSLAMVAVGDIFEEQAHANRAMDFYDLKHDIEQLLPNTLSPDRRLSYERSQLAFLHPWQSANLLIDDKRIGWFGQLHPSIAKTLDLPTTWVAQLDIEPLQELWRQQSQIKTPSKFPSVRRDLAILVADTIDWQTIAQTIRQTAGKRLADMWLFDVYQGNKIPAGKRSLAFALIWQDQDQTLEDDTVRQATDQIVQTLVQTFNAQLRDG